MCNLYKVRATVSEMATVFRASNLPNLPDFSEIYPKQEAPIIWSDAGTRCVEVMTWGFPPPQVAGNRPVTNVRNLASPFWRTVLTRPDRRCLVPVTAFCEWEGVAGSKRKVWFELIDQPLFAFAGVWRPTDEGPRFAFLTCDSNEIVGAYHPKAMPVILTADDAIETWLTGPMADALALAKPYASEAMQIAR